MGEEAFQTEGPQDWRWGTVREAEPGGAWRVRGGVGAGLLSRTHSRMEKASPQEGAWLSSWPEGVATWVRRCGYRRGLKVKPQVWGKGQVLTASGVLPEPGKVGMRGAPREGPSRKLSSEVQDVRVV